MSSPDVTSNNAQAEFNKKIGIMASHVYQSTPAEIKTQISEDMNGSNTALTASIEGIFKKNVVGYIQDTFEGVLLNDLQNTNAFLQRNIQHELDRSGNIYKQTANQVHKSRINVFESQYAIHKNNFTSSFIKATLFVIIIVFVIFKLARDGRIYYGFANTIMLVITFIYIVMLTLFLRDNASRRNDDWNKYHFEYKPQVDA